MLPEPLNDEGRAENPNGSRSTEEMVLLWMIRGFLVWFAVYLFLQGQDGFFAVTVDRIQADWVKLIFLNIPAQLILATIASCGLTNAPSPTRTRFGLVIAIVNSLLIMTHVVLSIMTA